MKKGLVMEGGSMRGIFTAGVLDVFMENNIDFDGAVGVSAGAVFGCNIKSRQIGRTVRYNKKYCKDRRYASYWSWIFTGDVYNAKFDYERIPSELDPFDTETFQKNPIEFYVVATDVSTGKPVYHKCDKGEADDVQWLRASAAVPMMSRVVYRDGIGLSDGGTSDAIPLRYLEGLGYDRNIVITTQPEGYVKQPNKLMPILKIALRKYPALVHALDIRHHMYNETLQYIKKKEQAGEIFVIRPPQALTIKGICRDAEEIERVYQLGRAEAIKHLDAIRIFLQ